MHAGPGQCPIDQVQAGWRVEVDDLKRLERVRTEGRFEEDVSVILACLFGWPQKSARPGQCGQQSCCFFVRCGVFGNCGQCDDSVAKFQISTGDPADAEATEIQDRSVVFESQTCDAHVGDGWNQDAVGRRGLWNNIAKHSFP